MVTVTFFVAILNTILQVSRPLPVCRLHAVPAAETLCAGCRLLTPLSENSASGSRFCGANNAGRWVAAPTAPDAVTLPLWAVVRAHPQCAVDRSGRLPLRFRGRTADNTRWGCVVAVSDERDPLITRSEIASYAGVERPTVSNWARRHQDFPTPMRSGDVEYFRLTSVLRWLGGRRIPRAQLRADEGFGATYRDRVLSGWQARNGPVDPVSRTESAEGAGEADKRCVSELMESLSDQIGRAHV